MEEKELKERRKIIQRFNVIFFIIFVLFVSLILRLAYLQLVEGENYVRASQDLSYKSLYISAPRGWILDRNGEVLVDNKPIYTVTFLEDGQKKEDLIEIAEKLEKLLVPIDPRYNRTKILEKMDAGYRYVSIDETKTPLLYDESGNYTFNPSEWEVKPKPRVMASYYPRRILEDVPKEVMFYIAEHRDELRGVDVIIEPKRQYKKGAFATHILGYTKPISPNDLDFYLARGYRADDKVGLIGLEKSYESQLKGKEGIRQVRVNSQAKTVETRDVLEPQRGNDLILTIDWKFQKKIEDMIEEELEKLRTRPKNPIPHANEAVVILMNPNTGEIYTLVNHPQYDLNIHNSPDFGSRYSTEVAGREQNFALSGLYQPGSTAKMLSILIGLEEKIVGPNEKILSTGSYTVGNMIKRDWKRGGHGQVDARKALKESVNTYMYVIAMRLANYPNSKTLYKEKFEVIDYYYSQFGLGVKTGIDLPDEKRIYRSPDKQLGRLADAMIGQYHQYTPIQLAQYVSTIANGGYRVAPYLVKEIREPSETIGKLGKVVWKREPTILNQVDINPKHLQVVQEGMLQVTQGGTATNAFKGFPYKVAAKTGTAQQGIGRQNNALIVGYAPYDNPEVAFVVLIPGGGGGSDAAGPIARRLLDAYYGLDQAPVE